MDEVDSPFSPPGFIFYRESLCLNFMAIGQQEQMLFHQCVYRWMITMTTETYHNMAKKKIAVLKTYKLQAQLRLYLSPGHEIAQHEKWNGQYVFFHWILCKLWTLWPLSIQFWILIIYQCSTPNIIALASLVMKKIFNYLIKFSLLSPSPGRVELPDIILKGDGGHRRTIPAKFGPNWYSVFRGKD